MTREQLAEWLFNYEADVAQAHDEQRGHASSSGYARWPKDAHRQPYCRWAYNQADALLEALASHAPSEAAQAWSECPRCDNGIHNGRECAICWGTGRVTESLLQQEAAAQPCPCMVSSSGQVYRQHTPDCKAEIEHNDH